MEEIKAFVEQRKHKRFEVRGRAVAFNPNILGQVKNISMGGLAFLYVAKEDDNPNFPEIDIFITGDSDFYMEKVPVRVVADHFTRDVPLSSTIIMKQRRLEFGKLSPSQKMQLDYFIRNYTLGEG